MKICDVCVLFFIMGLLVVGCNQSSNINKEVKNEVITKDAELVKCQQTQDQGNKDFCFGSLALKRGDTALCDNVIGIGQPSKDACITNVALDKMDASLCEKIQDEVYKNACKQQINLK